MSPMQEQMDLPLKIGSQKELTKEEMQKAYLNAKASGLERIINIRNDYKRRMEEEKKKKIAELVIKGKKENYQEGNRGDYEEYIEMEKVKFLWGPVFYQLPNQKYNFIDAGERVEVYFGNDYNWHMGGKIVSDIYALEIIENNEDMDRYNEIVKRIEKLKELKK